MKPIPEAPRRIPALGHVMSLIRDPIGFMRSLPSHGDLVRIGLGSTSAVVVCDPQLTRQVLSHDRIFDKGGGFFDVAREYSGDGLVICPFDKHRRLRRLVQPAFHPNRITEYAAVMSESVDCVTKGWREDEVLDMKVQLATLAQQLATNTLFNQRVTLQDSERLVHNLVIVTGKTLMRQMLMPRWLRRWPILGNHAYRRADMETRSLIENLIAQERSDGVDRGDLLSAWINAADEDSRSVLSDTEICDQAITFFATGTETTSNTLAWALYLLDQHPAVAERLHSEVDNILDGRAASHDDLPQLPLTNRIITEVLRMYPPGWLFTRVATEDTQLGIYHLSAGTTIIYSAYLIHHLPELFPCPDSFDPDRWDAEKNAPPPRNAMIPFGAGARKCIADTFAVTEATLALATIANRWSLTSVAGTDVRAALSPALQPRRLYMHVKERHKM
ncbi:cytochrome P450 [Nocardia brasiliensis]|uniref:cytochrome P450 n=2 Tax=Nocardia brasiliensis TaxID=37326 RepID=UPI0005A81D2B|nr:cytochrome P450 [Nocardia brasiliensis]ASF12195.1 cytochrome P450 [Nocardia brasiliensis]